MNKTTQIKIAAVLAVLMFGALAAVVYLAFVFPKTLALWAEQGRPLSVAEQTIANLSMFCRSFGLFLFPLLLIVVVGSVVWAAVAGHGIKSGTANPPGLRP